MSNVFFGLNIGRSALLAHQTALDVTGHNLANVQTEGYSRQRVTMVQGLPAQTPQGSLGSGVNAERVERLQLAHLERQLVRVTVQNGYDVALTQGLDELQSLLSEPSPEGLGAALTEFWNSWDALAARPTDVALRSQVLDSADHLAAVYNRRIEGLASAEDRFDEALADTLDEVNARARELAEINGSIAKAEAAGYTANDLRDQRDRLVRQLAEEGGVDVESDGSYVNVRLADGGPYLVNRAEAYALTSSRNANGHLSDFHVGMGAATIVGGEMGALLELRDEVSPGLREDVSEWMATVVDRINGLHTAGVDRDGDAGRNLFNWTGEGGSVSVAPSSGIAGVTAGGALGPGTHHLVATADPDLVVNSLGNLSSGSLDLKWSGAYTGATLNLDYHVRVLSANGADGSLDGLRLQLHRGDEAVGPVVSFQGVGAGSQTDVAVGSVDGLDFAVDVSLLPAESFASGERGDGLSTKGAISLDGGPAVGVDLTSQNNIAFTGGIGYGFLAGGSVTVNFAAKPFDGATFTVHSASGRLAVDPVVAADTDKIAAARAPKNGQPAAVGDGEIARQIADLATEPIFEAVGETPAGFMGQVVQSLGAKGRDAAVFEEASTSILLQLEAQRSSVSGVNLDEEMVQLIQYQRGFEAAARFLTTVDTLIETLISKVGLAGR